MKTESSTQRKHTQKVRVRDRHQLNVEVEEKLKSEAQLCAMLEKQTVKEWCAKVIADAAASTLRQKGVQSPFDSHLSHSGYAVGLA